MARRVFFSFHYQDVIDFRANVVRNHWLTKADRDDAGFFDASVWETAKKTSPLAVKRLINKEIQNTTVTAVLIGSDTYSRRWVRYEIIKSMSRGNKLLGVHINCIEDKFQKKKRLGRNPFEYLGYQYSEDGTKLFPYEYKNGKWVEYGDYDAYTLDTQVPPSSRGKFSKLSTDCPVYDWIGDDGYENFSTWVE